MSRTRSRSSLLSLTSLAVAAACAVTGAPGGGDAVPDAGVVCGPDAGPTEETARPVWSIVLASADAFRVGALTTLASGDLLAIGTLVGTLTIGGTTLEHDARLPESLVGLRISSKGDVVWAKVLNEYIGGEMRWRGRFEAASMRLAALPDGGFVWSANFAGSVFLEENRLDAKGGWDLLVSAWDGDGHLRAWSDLGGPGDDRVLALAVDPAGIIAIAGEFSDEVAVAPGVTLSSKGGKDAFVGALSFDWSFLGVGTFGGEFDERVTGLAIGEAATLFALGTFTGEVPLAESLRLSPWGGHDVFFATLTPAEGGVYGASSAQSVGTLGDDLSGDLSVREGRVEATLTKAFAGAYVFEGEVASPLAWAPTLPATSGLRTATAAGTSVQFGSDSVRVTSAQRSFTLHGKGAPAEFHAATVLPSGVAVVAGAALAAGLPEGLDSTSSTVTGFVAAYSP